MDIDYGAPRDPGRLPAALAQLPRGRAHQIDVCYLNVNELEILSDASLRPHDGSLHHLIGSWFWELDALPDRFLGQVARVDEVWAPTSFVRDALYASGASEVVVMPCVVEPVADPRLTRSDFGLPETGCMFFFHFDAHSTFARKNPLGVIEAYRRAFRVSERGSAVHLVMKVLNLDRLPEARAQLESELASVGGILIEAEMASSEIGALISLGDVYISLHRAEGFGLGIAEAMYFGRPVIATAYSGPVDFLTQTNSCMVGYETRVIAPGDLYLNPGMEQIYQSGHRWVEPDVGQASRWMKLLAHRPEQRAQRGMRGSETIRRSFNSVTVGSAIRNRLIALRDGVGAESTSLPAR